MEIEKLYDFKMNDKIIKKYAEIRQLDDLIDKVKNKEDLHKLRNKKQKELYILLSNKKDYV